MEEVQGKPHYVLGTQNMLDLAGQDATLIPYNTVFLDINDRYVVKTVESVFDDSVGTRMEILVENDLYFYNASVLRPIVQ